MAQAVVAARFRRTRRLWLLWHRFSVKVHPARITRMARKATLARLLRNVERGLILNEHISEPGDVAFRHACKLGLEGIVSKRKDSAYRSGRSPDWLKMKNAPAVKREEGEEWDKRGRR